jgi:hypothetical protein
VRGLKVNKAPKRVSTNRGVRQTGEEGVEAAVDGLIRSPEPNQRRVGVFLPGPQGLQVFQATTHARFLLIQSESVS